MPHLRKFVLLVFCFSLILGHQASAGQSKSEDIVAAADHHLHIQGPALTEELNRLARRIPKAFEGIDPGILKQRDGNDALKVMDAAGIRKGVLLSEAYMFASPMARPDNPDVVKLTREENAFVVDEAAKSKGRLTAFIGVNPLAENAIPEIKYWARKGGARGIKLHLANSGFDFSSPDNVKKLADLFSAAGASNMAIVIHLRNSPKFSASDAQTFVNEVLPKAGSVPVQIAHGAGWGGLDEATIVSLGVFADAIAKDAPGTRNVFFDLALIVLDKNTDAALAERFAQLMRRIGLNRFVFASDWPGRYTPGDYKALLVSQLPLKPDEWQIVLKNEAPYLK